MNYDRLLRMPAYHLIERMIMHTIVLWARQLVRSDMEAPEVQAIRDASILLIGLQAQLPSPPGLRRRDWPRAAQQMAQL